MHGSLLRHSLRMLNVCILLNKIEDVTAPRLTYCGRAGPARPKPGFFSCLSMCIGFAGFSNFMTCLRHIHDLMKYCRATEVSQLDV